MIASELGDIKRFSSAECLASYSAMTPRVHSSGSANYLKNNRKIYLTGNTLSEMTPTLSPGQVFRSHPKTCFDVENERFFRRQGRQISLSRSSSGFCLTPSGGKKSHLQTK
ncbi:MAG: transposase [Phycisphaerae bacterium]|nr:transposase [Phycisphaerae bacterium]